MTAAKILERRILNCTNKGLFNTFKILKNYQNLHLQREFCDSSTHEDLIRNIGIIAHIDAGKTTTTERMLYYSGRTKFIGEVHDGNTVMDYMDQERERGITISSAAVSFKWLNHVINLIDTPGHVDFTVEVERALRVLDGAVAIFDASAGVEAQSLTVWLQSDRYKLPRLAFLNKMDKAYADAEGCVIDIEKKLNTNGFLLHMPVFKQSKFHSIVDLISMRHFIWNNNKNISEYTSIPLVAGDALWDPASLLRRELVEKLSDFDDAIAEQILLHESTDCVDADLIFDALKRITLENTGVPILIGSAYKNIGTEPLLDSITRFLPSPVDRKLPGIVLHGGSLCAVAFKVIHHRKNVLVFLRIYSGTLSQGQRLYNATQNQSEKITKIFVPFADEFENVSTAKRGDIVVVAGLKDTTTGDTLVASREAFEKAQNLWRQNQGDLKIDMTRDTPDINKQEETTVKKSVSLNGEESTLKISDQKALLLGVTVPEPVFMCSVECSSLSEQKILEDALDCLQKEDPSLRVHVDEDTGQTVLAGMGELHLQIIRERVKREYKVDAYLGPLIVSYRETLQDFHKSSISLNKNIGDKSQSVEIELSLEPCERYKISNAIDFASNKDNFQILQSLSRPNVEAIVRGVKSALLSGPLLRSPVINVRPALHNITIAPRTAPTFVSAAASQCIQQILKESETLILEPVMRLEIVTPVDKTDTVLGLLASKRTIISNVTQRRDYKVINGTCPLAEMQGFSTVLRTTCSGMVSMSMEFETYRQMTQQEISCAVEAMMGVGRR